MSINVTAKSKVYISQDAFNGTPSQDDFDAATWIEIGEVTNLGSWGAKGKEVTTVALSDAYTRRLKGSIDSGTVALECNRDPADKGQNAARAAAAAWDTYLFKVELNDKIVPTGDPSFFYFRASVMSAENKFDGADSIIMVTFNLGITGAITEIEATVPITFSPTAGALPGATSGSAYSETIVATGGLGVVSYAITEGALPSSITLNSATGVISGTHTGTGSFSFTITATFDGAGEDDVAYTL